MLLFAAVLQSRVAIEVLSTEPRRVGGGTAAAKVPSLQCLCRKTSRRQLGKLSFSGQRVLLRLAVVVAGVVILGRRGGGGLYGSIPVGWSVC